MKNNLIKRGIVYERNGRRFAKKFADADRMTKGTVVVEVLGRLKGVAIQFKTESDLQNEGGSHSLPLGVATEKYFKRIEG